MRLFFKLCAGVALLPLAATQAEAAIAVYTISGNGSGSLNGVGFNGADFTFTLTGDTANLAGNVLDPLTSAVASIDGFAPVTFSFGTRLGVSGNSVAFFSRTGNLGLDLFDFRLVDPVNLGATFGPVTGTGVFALDQFQNVATSGGPLSFNQSSSVQFSGRVGAAVPEPANWAMMIAGFGLLGAASRRRARASITYA